METIGKNRCIFYVITDDLTSEHITSYSIDRTEHRRYPLLYLWKWEVPSMHEQLTRSAFYNSTHPLNLPMFFKVSSLILGITWWRHQMETFSALLAICAGNSPVPGEFPAQRPVTRSFDVCFDLRLNKQLSKQSWGWWFETLSWSLWRHSNESHESDEMFNLTTT